MGRYRDKEKRIIALKLRLDGFTYAAIGKKMELSRQRIQQLLRPPADTYNAMSRRAANHCEACGVLVRQGHAHHRQNRGLLMADDFNDLKNLSYLCLSCHRSAHGRENLKMFLEKKT